MLPQSVDARLKELKELDKKITRLTHIAAILEWDQETYLPNSGIQERSEQLALIEGQIHDLKMSPFLGVLTTELSNGTLPNDDDRALVRIYQREHTQAQKLPHDLVEKQARLNAKAQRVWGQARQKDDFNLFAPYLTQQVSLARETAQHLGYQDHPYDALLDQYEPGLTTSQVQTIFTHLETELSELVKKIVARPQVDSAFLSRRYPKESQEQVAKQLVSKIGFNWEEGRLDVTNHPFCTTLGPQDIRLTTRYDENFFNMGFYGIIHEMGHGLYEQGADSKLHGSSLAGGTSLGIHESQSRFWEMIIGRSQPFIDYIFPQLSRTFSTALADVDSKTFYRGINRVCPSFIRTEADEVTYNLHILLRFKLEKAMVDGSLAIQDVPAAWDDEMERLLGIRPKTNSEGCMQDIHWAMGGLGYFPTYALGNLYAGQFFHTMKKALPDWEAQVRAGNFAGILLWLRENIHRHGSVYLPQDLCKKVTGESLNPQYFLNYLKDKFGGIYGI